MNKRILFIIKLACTALLMSLLSCKINKDKDNITPVYPGSYPTKAKIEYRVVGVDINTINSITYTDSKGEQIKLNETVLPFSLVIEPTVNKGDKFNLDILHTNPLDTVPFSVILEIWIDGKLQKTESQTSANNSVVANVGVVFE